jgi:NAD-dependent dihydropyrimidine dehydrogenase PreA subunit
MIDVVAIFLAWLGRTPLPVKVELADIKPNHVNFSIEGWNCFHGSLNHCGINIYAMHGGDCWDIIWDSDISPKEFDNGWGCGLCIDAWEKGLYPKPASYGSPEVLWVEHTLEPFRDWLEKLVRSAGIAFIDYDGATEAKLLREEDQISELAVEDVGRSLLIGRIDA